MKNFNDQNRAGGINFSLCDHVNEVDPAHPVGWHDDVPEGASKLDNLLGELENANEEECESCAI